MTIGLVTAPAVQADDSPTVCATGCAYSTIQSAIDAATSGATIEVGAGIYTEKLTIGKSLSLIGIGDSSDQGAGSGAPTIDGQIGDGPAVITVNSNSSPITVKIHNLNITHGGNGIDVLQNAVMTVDNNTISGYFKNGVTFGPLSKPGFGGVSGKISDNVITGAGPTGYVAQNGIQISESNTAAITGNQVSSGVYTSPAWSATGILIYGAGNNNSISGNAVDSYQNGIYVYQSGQNKINENIISNTSSNGIFLDSSSGNNISENEVSGINPILSGVWGIALDGSANNTISDNKVQTSDVGLWDSNSANDNTFTKNTVNGNNIGVQVDTNGGAVSTGLQFHFNSFAGNTLSFTNTTTVIADATNNWWGSAAGPGTIANVTTTPWCTDNDCEKKSNKSDSESSSHSGDKSAPGQKPSSEGKSSKPNHAGITEE